MVNLGIQGSRLLDRQQSSHQRSEEHRSLAASDHYVHNHQHYRAGFQLQLAFDRSLGEACLARPRSRHTHGHQDLAQPLAIAQGSQT